MQSWKFNNPVEIIYGCGSRKFLVNSIKGLNILIVTTKRGRNFLENDSMIKEITKNAQWIDSIKPNPGINDIENELKKQSNKKVASIIAFGGGSSLDSAKVIAAGLSSNLSEKSLYELIENPNYFLTKPLIPVYAIPTTAGTGSEVTPFSTLWDYDNKKKLSLQHKYLYPKYAIVDPELTYDIPFEITASCGLDALNQAFESIWNKNKTPFSTFSASRAIRLAIEALPRLNTNINDKEARLLISEASLFAGIAISQTRTAICHSISYPLTAKFGVMHGLACAFTMYSVAKKVNDYDSNCFSSVLKEMNLNSSTLLIEKIKTIVEILNVKERVINSFSNRNEVFELIDEMITPGRSDNFTMPINKNLIKNILEESF